MTKKQIKFAWFQTFKISKTHPILRYKLNLNKRINSSNLGIKIVDMDTQY